MKRASYTMGDTHRSVRDQMRAGIAVPRDHRDQLGAVQVRVQCRCDRSRRCSALASKNRHGVE